MVFWALFIAPTCNSSTSPKVFPLKFLTYRSHKCHRMLNSPRPQHNPKRKIIERIPRLRFLSLIHVAQPVSDEARMADSTECV
ncbi:hypothetical protein K469DRAFT_720512, partial [Zopfia rhizophila CBS 207.26]